MTETPVVHRYLIALPRGAGRVALSWRLLASDAPAASFHVERDDGGGWRRVTDAPVVDSTTYLDAAPGLQACRYRVVSPSGAPSEVVAARPLAEPCCVATEFPLDPDLELAWGLAVGDLENNGRLGYVLRGIRGGTIAVVAYSQDGRLLWEHDTHLPARGGWDGSTLHCPLLAWDVNADGRTEVAYHAYPGAYPTAEYDTAVPGELLVVVDGETGERVWQSPWPATRSRVMMTVGLLRGPDQPADLVVQDETYGPVTLTAVDGRTGQVSWRVEQARPGGHNLDVADIDGDGRMEVICGGVCYNANGTVRWEAEPFGHTDLSKPARIAPHLEGLQIWYAVESHNPGVYLVDNRGRTLFREPFRHAHYGWVARHTSTVPGLQPHTAEDGRRGADEAGHYPIYLPDGSHWLNLTDWQRKVFVPVHWDEGPEVAFIIRKDHQRVVRLRPDGEIDDLPESDLPAGGVYGRNLGCVDVLGDYRENIVTVDEARHSLIVLANPTISSRRGRSPWDDAAYRHDRSQLASGYYVYLSPPDTRIRP